MKKIFKRTQSILLAIALLTSMGFTTLASGETQIPQDETILYSDDFSTGYTDTAPLSLSSPDYADVQIGGGASNWYLTKGISKPAVSIGAQFGSEYFRIGAKNNISGYYASDNYKATPYLAYKGAEYSNLSDNYKIKANIQDNVGPSAIRFMIDDTQNNYYELYFAGNYDYYSGLKNLGAYDSNPTGALWIFDKYVNGERVPTSHCESVDTFTSSAGIKEDQNELGQLHSFDLEITVINNTITWKLTNVKRYYRNSDGSASQKNVTDISFSWTDLNPFPYKSSEAQMGFVAFNEQKAYLKSFSFENYDNFVGKENEPDNVLYKNVTKEPVEGIMTFDSPCAVRKIVNSGDDPVTVLLSEDEETYYKLGEVPANGSYVNTLTCKKYQYLKVEGGNIDDLSVYTDIGSLSSGSDAVAIEARIDGQDVTDPTIESSDSNKIYCEGNKIYPLRAGETVLTVSDGTNFYEFPVNVTDTVNVDESFSSAPIFVKDGTDLKVFFDTSDFSDSNITPIVAAYNQEGSSTYLDEVWILTPNDENNLLIQTISDYDESKIYSAFAWNINDMIPHTGKSTY